MLSYTTISGGFDGWLQSRFLFSFYAQPFLDTSLYVQRSPVSHYTPARWRTRIILTRVNYELRKIVSEDDLHTQRTARKGIDVRRAGLGSFMSRRREGGPVEKKKGSSPAFFAC